MLETTIDSIEQNIYYQNRLIYKHNQMNHIHKIENSKHKLHIYSPFAILFLLMIGIVISLVQLQQQQQTRSRAAVQNCTVSDSLLATSSAEQTMFDQINAYRQQQGVPPLLWSSVLKKAATWMSNDMLTNEKLNHIDSLGRDITTRLTDCGYPSPASLGENIDNGTSSASAVLTSWKHAPPYNANLLNSNFTQAGIALATGSATQSYWTINLAGPAASISATITLSTTPTASSSPSVSPSSTPSASLTPKLSPTTIPSPTATTPTQPIPPTNAPTPTYSANPPIQTPTPSIYPGYTLNPLDTQILVAVKIPSIGNGGNKSPKTLTRQVDVGIYNSQNKQVAKGSGPLTYDGDLFKGVIHLGTVPNETYYIKVVMPYTLQALAKPNFQALRNDRLNALPQVILIQGDLNKDNVLTLVDYNLALACFQGKSCVTKSAIDFNDDGVVNVTDYNLLLQNFWAYRGD
jgi:uncharacterized protein YkwD